MVSTESAQTHTAWYAQDADAVVAATASDRQAA